DKAQPFRPFSGCACKWSTVDFGRHSAASAAKHPAAAPAAPRFLQLVIISRSLSPPLLHLLILHPSPLLLFPFPPSLCSLDPRLGFVLPSYLVKHPSSSFSPRLQVLSLTSSCVASCC